MNRFIMANAQQCIGCRTCEVACVMAHNGEQHALSERHFHPRITVLTSGLRKSPVTCHHCENAPCAQSCPNGAITQHSDSVQVNQQKCIGCKACVVACPFGTMDMLIAPLENDSVKASAHKCDLCSKGRKARPALKTARQRCLRSPPQPCWISWLNSADSAAQGWTRCRGTARRFSQSLRKPNGNRCKTPRRAVSRISSAPTRAPAILTDLLAVSPGTGAARSIPVPEMWRPQHLRVDLPAA